MRQFRTSAFTSIAVLLLVCLGLLFPHSGQAAEKQPSIVLNGTTLDLPQAILQVEQSILIPIRVVSEQLGYEVRWEGTKQLISIQSSRHSIQLTVDHKEAIVNKQPHLLDVPATIQNQTTFVPLRFVGESMGLSVTWDNDTKIIHIEEPLDSSVEEVKDNVVTALSYSNNTLTITSQQKTEPTVTVLNNPNRIVLDYANTVFSEQISQDYQLNVSGTGKIDVTDNTQVQQIRFSIFSQAPEPNAVRFVIDTTEELAYSTQQDTTGTFLIKLDSSPANNSTNSNDNNTNSDVDSNSSSSSNNNNNTANGSIQNNPTGPTVEVEHEPSSAPPDIEDQPDSEYPDIEDQPDSIIPDVTLNDKGQYLVVVDAGHGGHDSGAVSIHHRLEKDFTLAIALKVAELANQESRIQVLLTRSEDVYPTLTERVDFANQYDADLFISIHGNSVDGFNPVPNGTETYYYREESKAFAERMQSYIVEATGFRDRGFKKADHRVTHYTTMPAILLEVGFLSNPDNESQMFTSECQWRIATQIINGIKAQLGLH